MRRSQRSLGTTRARHASHVRDMPRTCARNGLGIEWSALRGNALNTLNNLPISVAPEDYFIHLMVLGLIHLMVLGLGSACKLPTIRKLTHFEGKQKMKIYSTDSIEEENVIKLMQGWSERGSHVVGHM